MANLHYVIFLFSIFVMTKFIQCDQDGVRVIQQEPINIFLKDNDDLKVDLDISDDNYEILDKQYTKLRNKNEDKLFQEFNRIVSREYKRVMERNRADAKVKSTKSKSFVMVTNSDNRTLSVVTTHVRLSQTQNNNDTNKKVEHNMLNFYADVLEQPFEPLDTGFSDELQKISSFNTSHNCTEQLNGTGIKAFKCFVVEFYKKQDYNNFAKHFWKIAAIWMVVYLVITLPLWFTRGWGSCCLCCKFFKPQQTIQEAKNYLLLNPPGLLVTKKGGIIHYEPTEREKYCYEEFGHFLRTL